MEPLFGSATFCLVMALLLLPRGFGGLISAIGRIRGWNTKRAFWVAAISYALVLLIAFIAAVLVSDVAQEYPIDIAAVTFFLVLVIIGVLSPLGILFLRWRYPDTFKKSTTSQATPLSNAQAEPKKEPTRQKQQPIAPPTMNTVRSGHIFVSYRRSDSADIAGRIYDRLIGKFGKNPVFKDVDSIPLGLDFKEYLDKKVGECNVLLAVIGDRWIDAKDATGKKRLADSGDFVRIEIESALERGIPVIPLLVRGAQMPSEKHLPPSLKKLVYRNGIQIRSDPDFHNDMNRLISALNKYI